MMTLPLSLVSECACTERWQSQHSRRLDDRLKLVVRRLHALSVNDALVEPVRLGVFSTARRHGETERLEIEDIDWYMFQLENFAAAVRAGRAAGRS
jgi:hypothetical protein